MFSEAGVDYIFHYAPLHYLPYVARARYLYSKKVLRDLGFSDSHFRSTSWRQDVGRGFESYIHLSLSDCPPILRAKLSAGFPHFEIAIPASEIEALDFHLCRFNIAKTRYFRGAKSEPPESAENGRYRDGMRLPIAVTEKEKRALFRANYGVKMIEVLIRDQTPLSENIRIQVFHPDDQVLCSNVLDQCAVPWALELSKGVSYVRNDNYAEEVENFIIRATQEPDWKGGRLEFDRV